ncbi:hypothetical protein BGZ98_004630 [Dissophora globulifera]|nr:hypothetical protein BGZ98_004630 [Dissophora globulifera]
MSSAYGSIARPVSGQSLGSILPRHATLIKRVNGEVPATTNSAPIAAVLFRITSNESIDDASRAFTLGASTHSTLVEAMHQVFNNEVEKGDTYPQEFVLDETQFHNYFFSGDAFVLLKGNYSNAAEVEKKPSKQDWEDDLLGYFYVKPNFPGRCSHICNGGFIVNPIHRGLGIGSILGKAFLKLVPVIGYKASMFNLVFVSNTASIRLWRSLGFKEIGRIPKAGRLRGQGADSLDEGYVDAIQFYWDFETMAVPAEYDA